MDGTNCVKSPNYPSNYGNQQSCNIGIGNAWTGKGINPEAFNTESRYDKLTVNGNQYSGTGGPPIGYTHKCNNVEC